jgi:ribosomal subunit interface protein
MQLTVKGKHIDVGDALRTHVADSLQTLIGKYFSKPVEANVVFSRDGHLFKADIQVHAGRGIVLQCAAEANEPYPAFDAVCDRLANRLRRFKGRLRNHHGAIDGSEPVAASYRILDAMSADSQEGEDAVVADDKAPPMVIAEMQTSISTLTVSEAVMRMELGELPALLFHNRGHGGLNMVYRRADGNVGWVDPQGAAKAGA